MKITHRRSFFLAASFLTTTVLAQAHPGHDGDGLTWDFGHLAGHPLATLSCALVLVAGVWVMAQLVSAGSRLLVTAVRRHDAGRRD